MLNGQGHHLVQVEDFNSLVEYVFVPHSTDFAQATQSFLFVWLAPLPAKEFRHKLLTDLPYDAFKIITGLLLLTDREKALTVRIKGKLEDQIRGGHPIIRCIEKKIHLPTKLNLRSP